MQLIYLETVREKWGVREETERAMDYLCESDPWKGERKMIGSPRMPCSSTQKVLTTETVSPQVKGAAKESCLHISPAHSAIGWGQPREVWRWSRGGGPVKLYSWGQLLALAEDVKRVFSRQPQVGYLFCSHMFPLPQSEPGI